MGWWWGDGGGTGSAGAEDYVAKQSLVPELRECGNEAGGFQYECLTLQEGRIRGSGAVREGEQTGGRKRPRKGCW